MNLGSLFNKSIQSFSAFWTARNARERTMLAAATAVVTLGLISSLLIAPALAGREQLSKNLPTLRQQAAQMQALSKEAAEISGRPATPITAISRENIEAALARKGLKAQSVMLAADHVTVQLAAASFADTLGWLDDMQKSARLSVADANIVALDKPDMVNVTLTLRQPGNE